VDETGAVPSERAYLLAGLAARLGYAQLQLDRGVRAGSYVSDLGTAGGVNVHNRGEGAPGAPFQQEDRLLRSQLLTPDHHSDLLGPVLKGVDLGRGLQAQQASLARRLAQELAVGEGRTAVRATERGEGWYLQLGVAQLRSQPPGCG